MYEKKPWLKYYDKYVPKTINYPKTTMYKLILKNANENPDNIAYDFMGYESTYKQLINDINQCTKALASIGVKKGTAVTIAMPNTPQAVIMFYALNKLGAIASMIHPLSPAKKIEFFLKESKSTYALTLDAFYPNFKKAMRKIKLKKLVLAKIPDYLSPLMKLGYWVTSGRKIKKVSEDKRVIWWKELMSKDCPEITEPRISPYETAVILFTGGTTGVQKGVKLSHMNFITQGLMTAKWVDFKKGESILTILPIFHVFGLSVCLNAVLNNGGKCILVPRFTPKSIVRLIEKKRLQYLVGVPTLYDALNNEPGFQKADLSSLKKAVSGADTMQRTIKERFEEICSKQGSKGLILKEGYGLTETTSGVCSMPDNEYRENSIGIPFPDMLMKIVKPGTTKEVKAGEEGEICANGPAIMIGYLNKPSENKKVLKKHKDGKIWLHTGDAGVMDKDGFIYFKLRLKRLIKSSGFNVYPQEVEEALLEHPLIIEACVIGVPDQRLGQRVKAFVVLKDKSKASDELKQELLSHCCEHLLKYKRPREIEFRDELPKTMVGKVDYKKLEDEELKKMKKK